MKSFDDFQASLTPEVIAEIVSEAQADLSNVGDGATGEVASALLSCYFSIALLKRYHEWLHS